MTQFRTERDSMGEVRLPAEAYYGPQTQRAVENFPISGRTLPPELIHALGLVKWAAAGVNRDSRRLTAAGITDQQIDALLAACREVADGKLDGQFPIDVFQTGSGTSSNMNANEVIANRASELSAVSGQLSEVRDQRSVSGQTVRNRESEIPPHPSQRPRQPRPEQQRRLSHRHPRGRGGGDPRAADPRPGAVRQGAGRQGRPVEGHPQDRPHPPGRRRAAHARARDRRPGPAVAAVGPPGQSRGRSVVGVAHRRHGRGHGHQHPSRVRPPRLRSAGPRDRHPLRRGRRPFRGQRPARRAGRVSRPVAHHRRHALQRGEQHPLAGLRPPLRLPRDHAPRPPAGQFDHAGQGQSGALREPDAGGRPRAGQRSDRHVLRRRRRAVPTERDDAGDGRRRLGERPAALQRHRRLHRSLP